MFKVIEDRQLADKLWEARLLWYRVASDKEEWKLDKTSIRPSKWWYCEYGIQLED